nr:uncharacterized protein LOC120975842 [Aegilops tauschii subsp. strangulata]
MYVNGTSDLHHPEHSSSLPSSLARLSLDLDRSRAPRSPWLRNRRDHPPTRAAPRHLGGPVPLSSSISSTRTSRAAPQLAVAVVLPRARSSASPSPSKLPTPPDHPASSLLAGNRRYVGVQEPDATVDAYYYVETADEQE